MPAPQRPGQPLPPHIYRRRRIVALVLAALVIWGLIWAVTSVVSFVGGIFNPQPSAAPTQAAGQPCAAGSVVAEAMVGNADGTEAESFTASNHPYIWLKITNTSSVACTFNAGPAVQFFTIKSGNDLIWDSHNCDRAGLQDQNVTLEPNVPQSTSPSEWLEVRSSSSGCGSDQAPVSTGAYNLTVTVNGVISGANQFLIN